MCRHAELLLRQQGPNFVLRHQLETRRETPSGLVQFLRVRAERRNQEFKKISWNVVEYLIELLRFLLLHSRVVNIVQKLVSYEGAKHKILVIVRP